MSAAVRLSDPSVRGLIEDEIERLISMLDLVDGDPDLDRRWLVAPKSSALMTGKGTPAIWNIRLVEPAPAPSAWGRLGKHLAGSGPDLELAESDFGETWAGPMTRRAAGGQR
jgi:hypothetical protein